MTIYVPASYDGNDYRPSWTGNNSYPTVTIRGIFDSMEKAKAATEGWACADDYTIETFYLYDEDEGKELYYSKFSIDYDGSLYVFGDNKWGAYELNEIVDEPYSAVYDIEGALGVTDY